MPKIVKNTVLGNIMSMGSDMLRVLLLREKALPVIPTTHDDSICSTNSTAATESINDLRCKINAPLGDENDTERVSIDKLRHFLVLMEKVFVFWDEQQSYREQSNAEDNIAYEKTKNTLKILQDSMEEIIQIPKKNSQKYIQKIQTHIHQMLEKIDLSLIAIKGRKSLLAAEVLQEFLKRTAQTYLFDQHNHLIEKTALKEERDIADSIFSEFNKKLPIAIKLYAGKDRLTALGVVYPVRIYEARRVEQYYPQEFSEVLQRKAVLSETEIEQALAQLKIISLELLQEIIQTPHVYLPVNNNQEKNELLKDLLFSGQPDYCLLLKKNPEALEALYASKAFSNKEVIAYFSRDSYTSISESEKNTLINTIRHEWLCMPEDNTLHPSELELDDTALEELTVHSDRQESEEAESDSDSDITSVCSHDAWPKLSTYERFSSLFFTPKISSCEPDFSAYQLDEREYFGH